MQPKLKWSVTGGSFCPILDQNQHAGTINAPLLSQILEKPHVLGVAGSKRTLIPADKCLSLPRSRAGVSVFIYLLSSWFS